MKKTRHKLILFSIVLISAFFVNESRNFMFECENIQILFSQEHTVDIEVSHHHSGFGFSTDENWIDSIGYDFSCTDPGYISFLYNLRTSLQDFSDSVWQPPKSV
jgi:hypothetical protein